MLIGGLLLIGVGIIAIFHGKYLAICSGLIGIYFIEKYFDNLKYLNMQIKKEPKLGILHSVNGYWVSNEGTKQSPSYHVWIPSVTHSVCDSAYSELDLAVCRCNYLAENKIKALCK